METVQQIITKITQSSHPLILVAGENGDSLAAGLGLKTFLEKLEKEAAVHAATSPSPKFNFLPGLDKLVSSLDLTKNLVVDVSIKKTQIAELSYKKTDDKLSIYLRPAQGGELTPADVSFSSAQYPFDLIILIGIQSLEQLGEFYSKNTGLFFETALVNIDFRASNENYGQLNLVQLTSTSCSEIMFDLISRLEVSLIDETVATQLLTGIISETNSFQHIRTTPQTFLSASQLVGLGARQQEIVMNLYKTKSMGLLKLWGRVLSGLKQLPEANLAYFSATLADLSQAEASSEDTEYIIKEMAGQLNFAKIFLFLKEESAQEVSVYCHSVFPINLTALFGRFNPRLIDPQTIKFKINLPMAEAEAQVVKLISDEVQKLKPTA